MIEIHNMIHCILPDCLGSWKEDIHEDSTNCVQTVFSMWLVGTKGIKCSKIKSQLCPKVKFTYTNKKNTKLELQYIIYEEQPLFKPSDIKTNMAMSAGLIPLNNEWAGYKVHSSICKIWGTNQEFADSMTSDKIVHMLYTHFLQSLFYKCLLCACVLSIRAVTYNFPFFNN